MLQAILYSFFFLQNSESMSVKIDIIIIIWKWFSPNDNNNNNNRIHSVNYVFFSCFALLWYSLLGIQYLDKKPRKRRKLSFCFIKKRNIILIWPPCFSYSSSFGRLKMLFKWCDLVLNKEKGNMKNYYYHHYIDDDDHYYYYYHYIIIWQIINTICIFSFPFVRLFVVLNWQILHSIINPTHTHI